MKKTAPLPKITMDQLIGPWLDELVMHRAGADRVYLRTIGGLFAMSERWWCFAPVHVHPGLFKLLDHGKEYFYPVSADDAHPRRVKALIDACASWGRVQRSALHMYIRSIDLIADGEVSSLSLPREGVPDEDELPSGIVLAGVPIDCGELRKFTAVFPAEDLDVAGIDLPLGPGGMPTKMLVFRWGAAGQKPHYFALHRCQPKIYGWPTAPVDRWIDWEREQSDSAADVAKALAAVPSAN